ncbi:hypothetical protein AB0F13_17215 [Streptomyces sp. NPDC026206]|uniref:hypothetical protein n=1 Tax=Streptomyces sp. NPDC026206 TaxID=3157089 RepID=UPI0033FBDFDF
MIAVVFACGGAGAAVSAPAARAAAACGTDDSAPGHRGKAGGDVVPVPRADGRVEQFQLFYDEPGPGSYLPFAWHRSQSAPGGPYGDWERVSGTPVGPKLYQVGAVESADGRLEVLFSSYGGFCRTTQDADGGEWSPAEGFGLSPAPYHGGIVLFKERDGRLHAFASGAGASDSMQVRSQDPGSGDWGAVRGLGKVPDSFVGLGAPASLTQLADGRLHLVAREWNRDRYWRITERERSLSWGPWELCATAACA